MARRRGLAVDEIQGLLDIENSDSEPELDGDDPDDLDGEEQPNAEITSVREYTFENGQFVDMVVHQASPNRR
jgi:hypothetical protein